MTPKQREPKEKVTYSLPPRLRRLVDSTAGDLGMVPGELVAVLLTASLKGVTRPGIPAEVRRRLGAEADSSAPAGNPDPVVPIGQAPHPFPRLEGDPPPAGQGTPPRRGTAGAA
jgi:hypothetical protein